MTTNPTPDDLKNILHLASQLPRSYFKGVSYPATDLNGTQWQIRRTSAKGSVFLHVLRTTCTPVVDTDGHQIGTTKTLIHYRANLNTHAVEVL